MEKNNLGIRWCVILGAVGFLAGFIGPLILAPDANQGPLLGIFVTGPLGFISGLLLWPLSNWLAWTIRTQWKVLYIGCGILLVSVVGVALAPKPNWIGRLYTVEVLNCRPVSAETDRAISDWKSRMESFTWKTPRPDWQDQLKKTLGEDKGSVIEAKILIEKIVKKEEPLFQKERFEAGQLTTKKPQVDLFYISESCTTLPTGSKDSYFVREGVMRLNPTEKDPWPPVAIGDLLIRATLIPVPTELREFVE